MIIYGEVVKPLFKYSAVVSGKDGGRTSPVGPELIVEDHCRLPERSKCPGKKCARRQLWNEGEKALAHVHGLSRQRFIQLGVERVPTHKLDPRKKVSRPFLRRAETSKKPSRFEAPLSNSGSGAAGSRYGGGKALIALLSASIFGVGLVQSRGRVAS